MHGEFDIYKRLKPLQSDCVPVCLGIIHLPHEKSLLHGLEFTGLLLMAWAGWGVSEWGRLGIRGLGKGRAIDRAFAQSLTKEVRNALVKIHGAGVLHRDVALRNVMLQEITRRGLQFTLRVQLVDFELSRTRAMYRRHAMRHLVAEDVEQGDTWNGAVTRLGNTKFAEECAKELDICAAAVAEWCR